MDPNGNTTKSRSIVDGIPGILHVFDDGTVERPTLTFVPAGYSPEHNVLSKDILIPNPSSSSPLHARLYAPLSLFSRTSSNKEKVPIVLHFHGGGWCNRSPFNIEYHAFCNRMTARSGWIWLSLEYRLAPEHKLPTAYDDCFQAYSWLCQHHANGKTSNTNNDKADTASDIICNMEREEEEEEEPWLVSYGDFSKCFLVGESAGATNAHFLAMRIAEEEKTRKEAFPVRERVRIRVVGMALLHPAILHARPLINAFKQSNRMTHNISDVYIRLALPHGASYGHPLVNPISHYPPPPNNANTNTKTQTNNGCMEPKLLPAIIALAEEDLLCQNGLHYYNSMQQVGHSICLHFSKGQDHTFFLRRPGIPETLQLESHVVSFLSGLLCAPNLENKLSTQVSLPSKVDEPQGGSPPKDVFNGNFYFL